jgi:hypothetical protein
VTQSSRLAHLSYFTNTLFVALFEPRDVGHALSDLSWVNAMHKELENFERSHIWTFVEPPRGVNVIGTKWVFKNKQGEDCEIVRNKACLVAQGFSQVEGLDFGKTFAPIVSYRRKCLLGSLEVFRIPSIPIVHKLSKALYGLKQALWAWYARLKTFLLEHGYVIGSVDKTLFTLNHGTNHLLVQIYVDDITFGGSSHSLVSSFQEMMDKEF